MTDVTTIRSVIRYLGMTALLLVGGGVWLVRDLLRLSQGAGTIDAAAAAVIGGVFTLAGTTVGALGALLVSTRSGPTQTEITNQPDNPVPTVEET
jgi:hypothetical protein